MFGLVGVDSSVAQPVIQSAQRWPPHARLYQRLVDCREASIAQLQVPSVAIAPEINTSLAKARWILLRPPFVSHTPPGAARRSLNARRSTVFGTRAIVVPEQVQSWECAQLQELFTIHPHVLVPLPGSDRFSWLYRNHVSCGFLNSAVFG